MMIAFFCLLVSLPSRGGQVIPRSTALVAASGGARSVPIALIPDDESSAAATHFELAQHALRQRQWAMAQIECERALTLAETFRFQSADVTVRANYLAAFQQYNEFYLDLLMQQHRRQPGRGWAARAWEANERAQRWRWRQTLHELAGEGRTVALADAPPSILKAVQARLLDEQTVLLEYALGERRSYLWMVTSNEVSAYELAPRAVIEQAVQDAYAQLSQPAREPDCQAREKLSALLLRPIVQKRLLIVAEGALQQVPFSALTKASRANQRCRAADSVLAQHEVTQAPAALVLLERQPQASHKSLFDGVAVVADPVFGKHDERLAEANALPTLSSLPAGRGTRFQPAPHADTNDADTTLMPRLPFARNEAENVARWFAPSGTLRALGFAANRQLALDGRLANYPLIHFATHGYSNAAQSGLVLSQVNERGEAQDGLLQMRDICRLQLRAELVVLSACESGVAKSRDALSASLAEGFLFAGAHRVIGTLWQVNDAATAELMARFYAGLLGAEHLAPAAALRQAQQSLSRDARWRDPYYWAGFVLQGEW